MAQPAEPTDEALLANVRACTRCEGLPLGPRPIIQWSPGARILIAGQAPGRITHAKGVPFDDPSGDRLRGWLGVDRTTFYDPSLFAIVPMAFCYPGSGKSGDLPPPTVCADLWRSEVLERLDRLQLTIIIGRYAIDWHGDAPGSSVTENVARWRSMLPERVVLPHPSPRNRRWLAQNAWFENDLLPKLRDRVGEILAQDPGV